MLLHSEFAKTIRTLRLIGLLILSLSWLGIGAMAQSIDIATPAPVTSNEVGGQIDPRDLGDARLTDHFFAFTGLPGDLLITIEGRNLNGDVDVFNASGLRPLMKFSLYAETFTPVTKSIYLRKREDLIIRVEARTPNDDPGTYRLRFSGSFEPITSGPLFEAAQAAQAARAETAMNETVSTPGTGRRVTSAGARIYDPPEEVVAAPTREPTPVETPEPTPAETAVTKPAPTRTPRGRRVPGRRTRSRPPATVEQPATAEAEAKPPSETEAKPTTDTEVATEAEPKPTPRGTRRGGARRGGTDPPAVPGPVEESGPRLVIETIDGTLISRYMSSVRRVTVENGRVLVVGKDGKIERILLANVVRMVIAP